MLPATNSLEMNGGRNLDENLTQRVEQAIALELGYSAWQALLFHLGRLYELTPSDIWNRPQEFGKALEELLGAGGKIVIRHLIKVIHKDSEGNTPEDLARAVRRTWDGKARSFQRSSS